MENPGCKNRSIVDTRRVSMDRATVLGNKVIARELWTIDSCGHHVPYVVYFFSVPGRSGTGFIVHRPGQPLISPK
jgi:hypothetical protein